jgi:hypothetical protein
MNKIKLALIVLMVIAVLTSAIVIINILNNNQPSNLQNPTPTPKPITNVHISDFYFSNFFPAEGLSWHAGFNIKITNNETQTVANLTVTFNSLSPYNLTRTVGFYNNTYPSNQSYIDEGQPCVLDPLAQGETKTYYCYIQNNMDDYYRIRGYAFAATLKIGDTVLDQKTIDIP